MAAVTLHHFSGLAAPFVRSTRTVSGYVFMMYGAFPACRNYTVRAHIRDLGAAKWDGRENALRHAGACVGGHNAGHLHALDL